MSAKTSTEKTSTEKTSTEKVPGGKNVLVEFEDQIAWVTLTGPKSATA